MRWRWRDRASPTRRWSAPARVPPAANASFTLGYDGRFGGGYEGHAGFAGLNLRW